ncbi:MAG TPA: alpha/beta fold hydrolase [Vicinamibacterales bacterium]|nr:alpha/beta fold hydrolase [Vicinamibacterales bacterium]
MTEKFAPRPSLASGHLMTLFSWGNPRYFPRLPAPVRRYFDVDHDARVVADCHWQLQPWTRPTILALHGLNGSSNAHYMKGIAAKAFARGMNVVRLNQRNCGDTEHLSAGLFHSGLTHDAAQVIAELTAVDGLTSIAIAGYSLGGNLALKLAAEYGDAAPPELRAVAAVSPIIEIGECVKALERPGNQLYQWNFVKDLKRRMRRKDRFWPGRFDLGGLDRIRTVREFDEVYTAPHFGFNGADDYYYRASAMRIIERIRIPALVITAEDDPFVPPAPFRDPKISSNPCIDVDLCAHGGHCGFVGPPSGEDDGYWAETRIVDFVARRTGL